MINVVLSYVAMKHCDNNSQFLFSLQNEFVQKVGLLFSLHKVILCFTPYLKHEMTEKAKKTKTTTKKKPMKRSKTATSIL